MYALNMLDMVNGLTKGIISISPRDKDGNVITDFYSHSLKDTDGNEIKEWVAFKDYLESFDVGESGYPEIPDVYASAQGRKVKISRSIFEDVDFIALITKIIPIAKETVSTMISIIISIAKYIIKFAELYI